jgi:site-specific DNA-methyltransferase (cytosine-N4-specific)
VTPYYADPSLTVHIGDCRAVMADMEPESVHCVVTSPPYWGLRDYGVTGQLGLEPTPEEYVAAMVDVFREVRRVLRDDGTVWLNLGDSYASSSGTGGTSSFQPVGPMFQYSRRAPEGLKPKDLVGIPWRVAFALQADGWYLRSDMAPLGLGA